MLNVIYEILFFSKYIKNIIIAIENIPPPKLKRQAITLLVIKTKRDLKIVRKKRIFYVQRKENTL